MTIKKRVGPITADLLPIPAERVRNSEKYWDLYEMGEGGGWKRDKLPVAFWHELADMLDRWGGIDGDADSRLQAVICDRLIHETFHFQLVDRVKDKNSLEEALDNLNGHLGNLGIAQRQVDLQVRLLQDIRKNKKVKK